MVRAISNTSSEKLKMMLEVDSHCQLKQEADTGRISVNQLTLQKLRSAISADQAILCEGIEGTYRGHTDDFFHHLFPYLEAFSPNFVKSIQDKYAPKAKVLLDPFGGLGTAPFAFSTGSNQAYFCEVNPLMQHISELKIRLRRLAFDDRAKLVSEIGQLRNTLVNSLENIEPDSNLQNSYYSAFDQSEFFSDSTLIQILKLRTYLNRLYCINESLATCLEICILAAIVPASNMQRAGDLRKKRASERKKIVDDICYHIGEKLTYFEENILNFEAIGKLPLLVGDDSRRLQNLPSLGAELIITSPPYLNGTNYFRNTKLELWFLGIIKTKGDIGMLRDKAIAAGINDVRGVRSKEEPENSRFSSMKKSLIRLEETAYDRRIPKMIKWYGHDLCLALQGAIYHLKDSGIIAVDIGDSIYCGISVPTDKLVQEILKKSGCNIIDTVVVRQRKSRSGSNVKQFCIVAKKNRCKKKSVTKKSSQKGHWDNSWKKFKFALPHTQKPYSSRNWGHDNHSMCSYQGKLKPAIAKFLVNSFVPENGSVLDPFSGVGTIPFEAALSGKKSFGFDISPAALAISKAKVWKPEWRLVKDKLDELECYISSKSHSADLNQWLPNYNKALPEYYHINTLRQIIAAREWFLLNSPWDEPTSLILSCCMHILHGNRPYALSRRSHPITPFSPTGEFEDKCLIEKLRKKIGKVLAAIYTNSFINGEVYSQDATDIWPVSVDNIDAVITSPPFFNSTKFYLANWIRLWFSGWDQDNFEHEKSRFVDERQRKSFNCYAPIIRQSKERMSQNGVLVFHLGKSKKCDMAKEIVKISKYWFSRYEIFNESVTHCESHGITDKGSVIDHQYLILY